MEVRRISIRLKLKLSAKNTDQIKLTNFPCVLELNGNCFELAFSVVFEIERCTTIGKGRLFVGLAMNY